MIGKDIIQRGVDSLQMTPLYLSRLIERDVETKEDSNRSHLAV